jgi:hypothetical protein
MKSALLKMSLMLGVLITLLLTPAFARWMYYEFGTAEGTQIEHPVHLGEFNYAPQTVTLPGDVTTPPEVTTPPSPGVTTPPSETPVVPEGENHSKLIQLLTVSEDKKLNVNKSSSILWEAIYGKKGGHTEIYSKVPNYANGNLASALAAGMQVADAEALEFFMTIKYEGEKNPTEIVVYSYLKLTGADKQVGDTWDVYQTYLKKDTNGNWVRDNSRTYYGEGTIILASSITPGVGNFQIVDPESIVYKTKQS